MTPEKTRKTVPPSGSQDLVPAPDLPYRPQDPQSYHPGIGLIGCGGITKDHLTAYKAAGYRVVAFCDVNLENAERRRAEFYPDAAVFQNAADLLARDDVEVVDIATHPAVRPPLIEAALLAGKHVLSQKPFVLDLDVGERLVALSESCDRKLAVNQNGRWAPHFSYAREAVRRGLLGDVNGVHMSIEWDHRWTEGTPFAEIKHLILYDYAIHWFDMIHCLLRNQTPLRVFASTTRTKTQTMMPPLGAQVAFEFEHAQASLSFDAATIYGRQDRTYIAGDQGSVYSIGPNEKEQQLTLYTADGVSQPDLVGSWFPDGFHGSMGELLCAIEENRRPSHSAADNLFSLSLCFAAIHSTETHQTVVPGAIRRLPIDKK
ncbi:Gfo/Idh/MocA family oxidoreductase [Blastopirellula sp. JC732]|uniref:Gfo/Idh/MocA family oxidoreductase n=1 Tax=Blastopirellula sediminis TaxID=2894196 RepID=A0A9X1SEP5_9BACT|nr:Gfo/Idh/MocA family oxidoreductase [Blastopirellula sediminis]MCC9608210.1 Gfo/Idh/MocA family oxidoreductase [Blastopirellula sediminis]MCC9626997.1 Gfo/Idh/MocA family oxidoreductase [Blastopirellula sediminis]